MSPPPTPAKSLCIPYKLRVSFILAVNFYVAPANPGNSWCFSRKMRVVPTTSDSLCFLKYRTRLGFNVIVTLHVMRPTAPDFHILFQGKHASQQPFQIPCVFSSQTRLGFNVIVHFTCAAVATMADKVSFNHLI